MSHTRKKRISRRDSIFRRSKRRYKVGGELNEENRIIELQKIEEERINQQLQILQKKLDMLDEKKGRQIKIEEVDKDIGVCIDYLLFICEENKLLDKLKETEKNILKKVLITILNEFKYNEDASVKIKIAEHIRILKQKLSVTDWYHKKDFVLGKQDFFVVINFLLELRFFAYHFTKSCNENTEECFGIDPMFTKQNKTYVLDLFKYLVKVNNREIVSLSSRIANKFFNEAEKRIDWNDFNADIFSDDDGDIIGSETVLKKQNELMPSAVNKSNIKKINSTVNKSNAKKKKPWYGGGTHRKTFKKLKRAFSKQ